MKARRFLTLFSLAVSINISVFGQALGMRFLHPLSIGTTGPTSYSSELWN